MKLNLEIQKKIASNWFRFLQSEIYKEFELLERKKSKKFQKNLFIERNWKKSKNNNDGGGTYIIILPITISRITSLTSTCFSMKPVKTRLIFPILLTALR